MFAIGAYSWETYGKTWSIPFGNPQNCEQSELIEVNKCLSFMGNMSVMMGIIGTFIGIILSLNLLVIILFCKFTYKSFILVVLHFRGQLKNNCFRN